MNSTDAAGLFLGAPGNSIFHLNADGIRKLRMVCYPLQILTVAMVFTWLRPAT